MDQNLEQIVELDEPLGQDDLGRRAADATPLEQQQVRQLRILPERLGDLLQDPGQRFPSVSRRHHPLLDAVVQRFPVLVEDRLQQADFAAVVPHQLRLGSARLAGDGRGGGLFEAQFGEERLAGLE